MAQRLRREHERLTKNSNNAPTTPFLKVSNLSPGPVIQAPILEVHSGKGKDVVETV